MRSTGSIASMTTAPRVCWTAGPKALRPVSRRSSAQDGERLLERLWPEAMPARFEDLSLQIMLQIMQAAIVAAKLKIYRPDIVVRPAVDRFRLLDFFEARAILSAAQPAKDDLKRELERHLA